MDLDKFHIYRDGQYDRKANIKMRLDDKVERLKAATIAVLWQINDSFERH